MCCVKIFNSPLVSSSVNLRPSMLVHGWATVVLLRTFLFLRNVRFLTRFAFFYLAKNLEAFVALIIHGFLLSVVPNQYFIKLQIRRIRLRLSRTFRLNLLPSTLKFRIPTSLKHTSLPCLDPPPGKRIHLWGRTSQRTKIL